MKDVIVHIDESFRHHHLWIYGIDAVYPEVMVGIQRKLACGLRRSNYLTNGIITVTMYRSDTDA